MNWRIGFDGDHQPPARQILTGPERVDADIGADIDKHPVSGKLPRNQAPFLWIVQPGQEQKLAFGDIVMQRTAKPDGAYRRIHRMFDESADYLSQDQCQLSAEPVVRAALGEFD